MAELDDVTLDGKPLHSLRVADLKSALEQRGLAKSGQKNALIKRLKGALMLENLQRTSTHHAGLQPNSQIGEEMSQNSFIKQYLAKQQELLRQRLEREAREATEADVSERQSPAGPEEDDHMLTRESTSCLPDKHHTVHSLSVTQAEGGGGDRGGGLPQDPGLMGSHRLDIISPSHLSHEPPDTKAGRIRHPSNFPSHQEVATPSPPRAVASLSVRVVGQPERQGLPLMMPRSQEREETAPVETGPAQSVLHLSRSARAAAFVQADSDDEEEDNDSDDDDEWGPSSNPKKNVRAPPVQPPPAAVPQRSRRKLQPPQHIPPQPVHQPPLQLRQPTPPPSPPPELSFPLPDTPKQSPHDQDEPVGDGAAPGPGTMPSPPPFKRQDSSSSSRSSSPEPPSTRRPGPLSLLVRKMESEGVFDGGQKVGIEGEMEVEEQEGSKPAEVLMGTNVQPQNSVSTTPSVQHDAHGLESKKESQEEKDKKKRGEEKETEKAETAAPFHMKLPKMFPLKRPQIFSAVPPPESLKSPSKPKQVSVLTTGPTCSEDDAMETEASTVMPESKHSEEGKEVKSVDKQSPRAEEENIMVPSSHSSSDGEPGKITDAHKPRSSPSSQSSSDSDSESSSSHSSSSPSHDKSRPHSQKKVKETENRKADIKEMKTQSPREIKREVLSEPAGQVAMEPEGRSDSESAMQQPEHQGADASDSRPEESSAAKLIARKISLSGKTENASSESESVGGANRKRRWGSSTAVTAKRPSISITTESLKTLIPEIKPVLEAVVELHPDEGQLSGEDSRGPHDVDKLEEDEGLKIRRTVTQIVPSDGCENGEKKIEDYGVDDDDDDEEEEKWTAEEKEKTRKREHSSDATMETQVADTIKVTPNDSLVRRSVSQQKSGVSITIDDPIRPSRELSPPRGKTSNIIHVCNLVRPFTLGQLKELLNRTGTLLEEAFWIDKIKSHCYVTYSTTEEAMATREALHGVKWPTSNPKVLRVDFCEQDELDFHKGLLTSNRAGGGNDHQASGTSTRPAAPPPHTATHREKKERERDKDGGVSAMRDLLAERERAMERRERTRSEREWDRDKVKDFGREDKDGTRRSRSRDRRRREREKSKEKRTEKKDKPEEPPAKLLDDLFRKTKAAPCIYWLPLTEEQATQRALEREERKKEREKRRKELQDEEDKKREERRERAKVRDRDGGSTGGGGGMGRSAEAERDRGKDRERERGREGEKRRDAPRGNRNGDSKTAGGSRHSRSRSNTSRDRRR